VTCGENLFHIANNDGDKNDSLNVIRI